MEYLIEKPKGFLDEKFVLRCLESSIYRSYISDRTRVSYDDVFILKKDTTNIGITFLNLKKTPENNIAYPIIYLDEKFRRDNNLVIMRLIEYIFVECSASKIVIQIYDNNVSMLNCMKAFKINYCGHINSIKTINDSNIGISFFDIDKKEWECL